MSYTENLCKKSLGLIFEKGIEIHQNYRPSWLINPITNKRLELDFYIPHIKTAIEIQGPHHYDDLYQIKKDGIKRQILQEHKITLVELSPFQISPIVLRKKILDYNKLSAKVCCIKPFDKNWVDLIDIKKYKLTLKSQYLGTECMKGPYINRKLDRLEK